MSWLAWVAVASGSLIVAALIFIAGFVTCALILGPRIRELEGETTGKHRVRLGGEIPWET